MVLVVFSYPGGPPYRTVGSPGGAGGGGSNYGGSEPKDGGDGDGAPWPGTPGNDPGGLDGVVMVVMEGSQDTVAVAIPVTTAPRENPTEPCIILIYNVIYL